MTLEYYPTDIKVGEIVTMMPQKMFGKEHPILGKDGFIEEIIVEPTPINSLRNYSRTKSALRWHSGTYSIYGFEQNTVYGHKDWYIGDFRGVDFWRTGRMVTEFQLQELYEKVADSDHRFQHDILTVIKNIGRTKAGNVQ
jgi:hypothetical protein